MPIGHQSLPAQQLHSSAAPSTANVNTACAYPPPVHGCVCVCVQYAVTKERIIALIDADRAMLQTLAEGVGANGGEAAVAASSVHTVS
jgi:hypothetical protein